MGNQYVTPPMNDAEEDENDVEQVGVRLPLRLRVAALESTHMIDRASGGADNITASHWDELGLNATGDPPRPPSEL